MNINEAKIKLVGFSAPAIALAAQTRNFTTDEIQQNVQNVIGEGTLSTAEFAGLIVLIFIVGALIGMIVTVLRNARRIGR